MSFPPSFSVNHPCGRVHLRAIRIGRHQTTIRHQTALEWEETSIDYSRSMFEAWPSRCIRSTLWTVISPWSSAQLLSSLLKSKIRPPPHLPPGYPPPGYPPYDSWLFDWTVHGNVLYVLDLICGSAELQGFLWKAAVGSAGLGFHLSLMTHAASMLARPGPDPYYGRPPPGYPPHYPPPHWRPRSFGKDVKSPSHRRSLHFFDLN